MIAQAPTADGSATEQKELKKTIPADKADSVPTPASAPVAAKNNKKPLVIVGGAAVLLLAAAGIYFAMDVISGPARIKDQAVVTQQVAADYNKNLDKIISNLIEDDADTADGMERSLEEARSLLKDAEANHKRLGELKGNISVRQLKEYKDALDKYLQVADKVIAVQKDNVTVSDGYIKPVKDYENLNVSIAGVSQYMYSDPNKYVSELDTYIKTQENIHQEFKKAQANGWFVEGHEVLLKTIDATSDLLKSMRDGVDNRSEKEIVASQQKFAEIMQTIENDSEKAEDNFDKKAKDLQEELEDAYKVVEDEYGDVKVQYKL